MGDLTSEPLSEFGSMYASGPNLVHNHNDIIRHLEILPVDLRNTCLQALQGQRLIKAVCLVRSETYKRSNQSQESWYKCSESFI